jgi:soluble lytic murein transglycosylase-like protein
MRWAHEQDYDDLIIQAAEARGLDPDLVKGLIATESGFQANAVGDDGNSLGLMQVQPATALQLGITGDLKDPATNLAAGTAYLAQQIARAGNEPGGISAYNGGWRPLIGFGVPLQATGAYRNQSYVDRVLANWAYFRGQHPALPSEDTPSPPPVTGHALILPLVLAGSIAALLGLVWLLR